MADDQTKKSSSLKSDSNVDLSKTSKRKTAKFNKSYKKRTGVGFVKSNKKRPVKTSDGSMSKAKTSDGSMSKAKTSDGSMSKANTSGRSSFKKTLNESSSVKANVSDTSENKNIVPVKRKRIRRKKKKTEIKSDKIKEYEKVEVKSDKENKSLDGGSVSEDTPLDDKDVKSDLNRGTDVIYQTVSDERVDEALIYPLVDDSDETDLVQDNLDDGKDVKSDVGAGDDFLVDVPEGKKEKIDDEFIVDSEISDEDASIVDSVVDEDASIVDSVGGEVGDEVGDEVVDEDVEVEDDLAVGDDVAFGDEAYDNELKPDVSGYAVDEDVEVEDDLAVRDDVSFGDDDEILVDDESTADIETGDDSELDDTFRQTEVEPDDDQSKNSNWIELMKKSEQMLNEEKNQDISRDPLNKSVDEFEESAVDDFSDENLDLNEDSDDNKVIDVDEYSNEDLNEDPDEYSNEDPDENIYKDTEKNTEENLDEDTENLDNQELEKNKKIIDLEDSKDFIDEEDDSFIDIVKNKFNNLFSEIKKHDGIFVKNIKFLVWAIVSIFLIIILIWFFSQKYFLNILEFFDNNNNKIILDGSDPSVVKDYGISNAIVFGEGSGSVNDLLFSHIFVSSHFGNLSEKKITGETGITASTYFGELMDDKEILNMFSEFVDVLRKMQNIYSVDVYSLLDKDSDREASLTSYLNDLYALRDDAKNKYSILKASIDELTISYNSLTPDKNQYEEDFFVYLEKLEPEKSDYLLKSFIDASQKQVALKARVLALQRLSEYYENAYEKLKIRISAVEKNRDALVMGIRVFDVQGSGIDFIIKSESSN